MEKTAVKVVALIAAVALIFGAGGWAGHKVSESSHLAKISRLETDLGAARNAQVLSADLAGRFKTYCTAIDTATAKQDAAIVALGTQARAHTAAAAAATAQARKDATRFQREAASILAQPAPAGVGGCAAASAAFDDELRAERKGVKP